MNKLEMAHDYLLKLIESQGLHIYQSDIDRCFDIADMVQAEADKREKDEQEKLKQDQQNHHDELVSIGLEEWQPDWSQAPDWAVAWTIDSAECLWWSYIPWFKNNFWFVDDSISWKCDDAPNFGYKGDWRDSLRKRPE